MREMISALIRRALPRKRAPEGAPVGDVSGDEPLVPFSWMPESVRPGTPIGEMGMGYLRVLLRDIRIGRDSRPPEDDEVLILMGRRHLTEFMGEMSDLMAERGESLRVIADHVGTWRAAGAAVLALRNGDENALSGLLAGTDGGERIDAATRDLSGWAAAAGPASFDTDADYVIRHVSFPADPAGSSPDGAAS